jgi:hypothetical protein
MFLKNRIAKLQNFFNHIKDSCAGYDSRYNSGYDSGYNSGYDSGYNSGYDLVYVLAS